MNIKERFAWCELGNLIEDAPLGKEISAACDSIKLMLLRKNQAYGNSAIAPVRIFSTASTTEQLRVRIDDKLSRLMRGQAAGEDVRKDLIGYLILLDIAETLEAER